MITLCICQRCGTSGKLSTGVKLPSDWTCMKCRELAEVEQVARMSAAELIDALVVSAIEYHGASSWHSTSPHKLQAIRNELDARLPPRS